MDQVRLELKEASDFFDNLDCLSSLFCLSFSTEYNAVQELVYWEDLPLDVKFDVPFYYRNSLNKYLTFQPDTGKLFFPYVSTQWPNLITFELLHHLLIIIFDCCG